MNNALDKVRKHYSLSILILYRLQDLAGCSDDITDLALQKSNMVNTATNGWTKDDVHWVSDCEQSPFPEFSR